MDLHDYKDVARNYDLYLPMLGSLNIDGFEEFHMSLAEQYAQDGILDIACGTGALTLPFAKAGYDVTALDLSAPMIEETRHKLHKENLKADLLVTDMTDFKIKRKFSLAIIARSGFMHLLSPELQRIALINIREHLVDGGILCFNTFQPYPLAQAEQMKTTLEDYTLRTEYRNSDGKKERIYNAITYDYLTQIMSGNWKFETLDDSGNIIDTRIRPVKMRQTYQQEMRYLFEICGFEVIDVYNDYRKRPANGNCIWVVKS